MKKLLIFLLPICLLIYFMVPKLFDTKKKTPIPKTIHYVWIGSKELPPNVKKNIQSWKQHMPSYQIKRWDETNCDMEANYFIKKNYKEKNYNFASDWCRLIALSEGGIYLDTDMVLNASIEPILNENLVLSLQEKDNLSASFIAVIPNHPFIKKLILNYQKKTALRHVAPYVWNNVFSSHFNEKHIKPIHKKGKYHIYPPNVLMYNFKGEENIAEHLFSNGSNQADKTHWFYKFRLKFLNEYAFYIPEEAVYFIPTSSNKGYFTTPNNSKTIQKASFLSLFNLLYIYKKNKHLLLWCTHNTCLDFISFF